MTRLDWTEKERKINRTIVETLFEDLLREQKNEGRTNREFFETMTVSVASLIGQDMITENEAVFLVTKYMMLYDPNFHVPTTEEELEQFKRDYPLPGSREE